MSYLTSELCRNSMRGSWSWSQARYRQGLGGRATRRWTRRSRASHGREAEAVAPWLQVMINLEQFERGDKGFQGWTERKCGDPFELSGWRDEKKARSGQMPAMETQLCEASDAPSSSHPWQQGCEL